MAPADELELMLRDRRITGWEREYRFCDRRWRFDFAWPAGKRLAVEVDGATWINGRHTRGKGYEKDCEKLNEAAILGWKILRFTTDMVRDGRAIDTIQRALDGGR
jgi:very-short-patch-repair endonuclease